jgi:hypothetical protein
VQQYCKARLGERDERDDEKEADYTLLLYLAFMEVVDVRCMQTR